MNKIKIKRIQQDNKRFLFLKPLLTEFKKFIIQIAIIKGPIDCDIPLPLVTEIVNRYIKKEKSSHK